MRKKVLSCILCGILLCSSYSEVYAVTNKNKIQENNKKISNLQKNREQLRTSINSEVSRLGEIQQRLKEQSEIYNNAQAQLDSSTRKVEELQEKIDNLDSKIDKKNKEIEDKEFEIKSMQTEISNKTEILGNRFRKMYEINMNDSFLCLLLTSKDMGDFITKLSSIIRIAKIDNKLINEIKDKKACVEKNKLQIETVKKDLESDRDSKLKIQVTYKEENEKYKQARDEQEKAYNVLQDIEIQKNNFIQGLKNDDAEMQARIERLKQDNQKLTDELNAINDKGASLGSSNNQQFRLPVNGPITCPFGGRISPITGKYNYHHGVDIGVGTGTPVLCAKDGVVVKAEYNVVYGNMVVVNHGNGFQTLYAHNSRLNVYTGQTVKQGQVLALSGSTGWSTGPHCHFEIRHNGQCINPM